MRKVLSLLALCLGFVVATSAAHARVNISINLSTQTMHVTSAAGGSHSWAISSARSGYVTPRGSYSPTSLRRMHYSRKYNNSPMPHSIFFRGGYAIHGTGAVSQLGRPASHGCIRLAPGNAARLFQMVKAEGASIHISGSPPASRNVQYAKAKKAKSTLYAARTSNKVQYAARRAPAQNYFGYAPQQRRAVAPIRAWQKDPAGSSWRW